MESELRTSAPPGIFLMRHKKALFCGLYLARPLVVVMAESAVLRGVGIFTKTSYAIKVLVNSARRRT